MSGQSIAHIRRQFARAKHTAQLALAAPAGEQAAVRALASELLAQCTAIDAVDAGVRAAQEGSAKEVREAMQALKPLAKAYDQACVVLNSKLGLVHGAASTLATPDDLLHSAEEVEKELEHRKQETWALELLGSLQPVLEAAIREQTEANEALKALQKAQIAREQAEGAARPVFVRFRRTVRVTFGRTSREYRELLDRRGGEPAEDDESGQPSGGAAGATPGGTGGTPGGAM
jgi:hypothetical protein